MDLSMIFEDLDEVPTEIYRAFMEEFKESEMVCFHNHIFFRENGSLIYQGSIVRSKTDRRYYLIEIERSSIRALDMKALSVYKDM